MSDEQLPYIVLLGDVGTGKSTIVEKLTGIEGISSNQSTSKTLESLIYPVPDGSLLIGDTPGSNSMSDTFMHNVWIAGAVNYRPVSRILVTVKADTRIDNVIKDIKKYAKGFLNLEGIEVTDILAICVTHMDTVEWSETEATGFIVNRLGLDAVIYSRWETTGDELIRDLHAICKGQYTLNINSDNFLNFFDIGNDNLTILKRTEREVGDFQDIYKAFKNKRSGYSDDDQADLIFEFQTWMELLISEAQSRVENECGFEYYGESMVNEVAHIAGMRNQLRNVIFHVRTETLQHQTPHGITQLRKCPHCGEVWAKLAGCEGATTCGNRMNELDTRRGVYATFEFDWDRKTQTLDIKKKGKREAEKKEDKTNEKPAPGCGKTIVWNEMSIVSVPKDFYVEKRVTVDDVGVVPEKAEGFHQVYYEAVKKTLGSIGNNLKAGANKAWNKTKKLF